MLTRRCALATALVLATSLAGAAPGAKPVLEGGGACLKTDQECAPLKVGESFAINRDLVAGEAGAVIKLGDGTTLDLAPGATLKLQVVMSVPLGQGEPVKAQTMTLLQGKMRVNAAASGKVRRAVLLRGARKAQIIVSGEASLSMKDDGLSAVNLGGKLLATTANDWTEVPALKAFTLTKEEGKPPLRDLLAAPKLAGGRWVSTSMAEGSELVLNWEAVAGAGSYEVRLARVGGATIKRAALPASAQRWSLSGLAPGVYEARVQAQDAGGLDGAQSAPARLAVVGVELPPGGFRSSPSVVQVAEGQTIGFNSIEGVEVAYDADTSYIPAARGFLMRGTMPRTLRFRTPGSSDEPLRVEPRSLGAIVEIGPKNARWPRDTLDVTVRLVNRTGGAVPPGVKLMPTVTLGVTPISVTFQDDGAGKIKASIPPQAGTLPNVVRVEVKDQYGIFLGRNFIEVSGSN